MTVRTLVNEPAAGPVMAPTSSSGAIRGTILALAWRELLRFFRQRNRVIGSLAQPLLFWILFSEGLKSNQLDYAHFFPGALAMILLFTAIFSTITVIEDRHEGFLQSVLVGPAPRWAMAIGKILGGATVALAQALLLLAIGLATRGTASSPGQIGSAVILMAILAVALTSLGFAIAWQTDSAPGYHAIMSVVLFPMWLLSGAFFPPGGAGWLSWIVAANPLTYGVAGLRQLLPLRGGGGSIADVAQASSPQFPSLAVCWGATVAFAVVTTWIACRGAHTTTRGDLR